MGKTVTIKEEVYARLDELTNFELGLSKDEWSRELRGIIWCIIQDIEIDSYSSKVVTKKGSNFEIDIKDAYIRIRNETCIYNYLEVEFDVFNKVVSTEGRVVRNEKVISA